MHILNGEWATSWLRGTSQGIERSISTQFYRFLRLSYSRKYCQKHVTKFIENFMGLDGGDGLTF